MSSSKTHKSTSLWQLLWICLAIIGLWFLNAVFSMEIYGESLNPFDGFGSLFSALAFAAIIFTVLLQREELKLQRQELRETREELKRSADAQERSELIMNKTAQVNALSQILAYYQTAFNNSGDNRGKYVKHMNEIKAKLDNIMVDLQQDPNDESTSKVEFDSTVETVADTK